MMCEWKRAGSGLLLLAVMAVLSGCGVKSSPAFPEDAVYPRQYPGVVERPVNVQGTTVRNTYNVRPAAPGEYVPPPAATDMPVK